MIWCVEDDAGIRDIELYALRSIGFETRGFEDGSTFWEALQREKPKLVVLDVMLPGIDGVELLRRMRGDTRLCRVPVIMATAKGAEFDKIQALDLGADDYLVKPFGMMEMVSRIKAVLRRCSPAPRSLQMGGLVLDPEAHSVTADGQRVSLTLKEFALLQLLLSHPNKAFTREELLMQVWETDFVGETRTVDMHIRTLRQKLGDYGNCIHTVRGVGYLMGEEE